MTEKKVSEVNKTVHHETQSEVRRESKAKSNVLKDKEDIMGQTGGLTTDSKRGNKIAIKSETHGLL